MTDLGAAREALRGLPDTPAALAAIVRGLVINKHALRKAFGLRAAEERSSEESLLPVTDILARAIELDPRPLVVRRPLERRVIGVCRHSVVLMTAFLRARGIPARSRCGFARYQEPGRWTDHWITEWWDSDTNRWVGVDPEMETYVSVRMGIDGNDLPEGAFINGGEAWLRCRRGDADPDSFGVEDYIGMWFVRGNVVRELAALNGVEMLPWDVWGPIGHRDTVVPEAVNTALDEIAAAICRDSWQELHDLYQDERYRVPLVIEHGADKSFAVAPALLHGFSERGGSEAIR